MTSLLKRSSFPGMDESVYNTADDHEDDDDDEDNDNNVDSIRQMIPPQQFEPSTNNPFKYGLITREY